MTRLALAAFVLAACGLVSARPDAEPKDGKVVTTKSGLKYEELKEGKGDAVAAGAAVKVHYTGWLAKGGKKFDSSLDRKRPFGFKLGAGMVIKGWDEGVAGMKVGGKRKLMIPSALAYGDRDVGDGLIPAGSDLVFEVELLSFDK